MQFPLIKILLERVSTSSIGREVSELLIKKIKQVVLSKCKSELKNLPFYPLTKDENYRADHEVGQTMVEDWIKRPILAILSEEASKYAAPQYDLIRVKFNFLEKLDGSWRNSTLTITIHEKFLQHLSKQIYQEMYDTFLNTGLEHCVPEFRWLENNVDEIVSIFVHEVAHAKQWQVARYKTTRVYRSYLERNIEKFWQNINDHGDEYLSSPQEIDSFSQDTVYDLLKTFQKESWEYQVSLITETMKYLSSEYTRYRNFRNSTNDVKQKVLKRYLKRVYQELDSRRDEAIAKHKQELKSAKEREEYDKWIDSIELD